MNNCLVSSCFRILSDRRLAFDRVDRMYSKRHLRIIYNTVAGRTIPHLALISRPTFLFLCLTSAAFRSIYKISEQWKPFRLKQKWMKIFFDIQIYSVRFILLNTVLMLAMKSLVTNFLHACKSNRYQHLRKSDNTVDQIYRALSGNKLNEENFNIYN